LPTVQGNKFYIDLKNIFVDLSMIYFERINKNNATTEQFLLNKNFNNEAKLFLNRVNHLIILDYFCYNKKKSQAFFLGFL
jgi:hypothetical protein